MSLVRYDSLTREWHWLCDRISIPKFMNIGPQWASDVYVALEAVRSKNRTASSTGGDTLVYLEPRHPAIMSTHICNTQFGMWPDR